MAKALQFPNDGRRYPDTDRWQSVVSSYVSFTEQHGTKELLMNLALGRVR